MTHQDEHITPIRVYLIVFLSLLILTVVTVAVSYIDLGGWNAIVAVVIASIKAMLVAFFFMHLLYDKKINLVVFIIGLVFVTLFIGLTMFDTLRRADLYTETALPIQEQAKMYESMSQDSTLETSHDSHQ
jgi:cytochrome c oxidase subunit 4